MAVQALTQAQKELVKLNYTSKRMTITEIARTLETSTRTIGRVLEEMDVPTTREKLRGDAYQATQLMKQHGVDIPNLASILKLHQDGPTRDQIIAATMKMEDGTWNALLEEILTTRMASKKNVHVQTAMLQIQEKVERNERDNKAGQS